MIKYDLNFIFYKMLRERIKGAISIIIFEIIIGIGFGIWAYTNYINLTKEVSKTENYHMSAPQIKKYNLIIHDNIESTGGKIYEGIFGYIKEYKTNSGNFYNQKISQNQEIQINIDKINYTLYLNKLFQDQVIDLYMYNYFLNSDAKSFENIYSDLMFLSKYFDHKFLKIDEGATKDQIEIVNTLIKDRNYQNLGKYLNDLENTITLIQINDISLTGKYLNPNFANDPEFNFLVEKIILGKDKSYSPNLNQKQNLNKYMKHVDEVAKIFDIDKNLIKSAIFVEQLRGMYTFRGLAKEMLQANSYLMNMKKRSFGVGGIKLETAKKIEQDLQQNDPAIYEKYFAYSTGLSDEEIENVRQQRLSSDDQYFDQILYVGGLIHNIIDRRKIGGIDISDDPLIILTLYNLGNPDEKKPHSNPDVGGATININDVEYTFGSLGGILYYYMMFYND